MRQQARIRRPSAGPLTTGAFPTSMGFGPDRVRTSRDRKSALNSAPRTLPEPRFGHEFSNVAVFHPASGRTLLRQIADEAGCPGYQPNEVAISHTSGHLNPDVIAL